MDRIRCDRVRKLQFGWDVLRFWWEGDIPKGSFSYPSGPYASETQTQYVERLTLHTSFPEAAAAGEIMFNNPQIPGADRRALAEGILVVKAPVEAMAMVALAPALAHPAAALALTAESYADNGGSLRTVVYALPVASSVGRTSMNVARGLSAARTTATLLETAGVQGARQIAYGSEISSWARVLRQYRNIWNNGGNVAVFQYIDDAGQIQYRMGFAQRFTGHAEQVVRDDLLAQGLDPRRVTKIYTELAPCAKGANCSNYIQQNFPNAEVYYSFTHDAAGKAERGAVFANETFVKP